MSRESPESVVRPVAAVGGIAFDPGGRVLLVRRGRPPNQHLWSAPGGRIELGESATDAIAREMAEETGLEVAARDLVAAFDWIERTEDGAVERHFVILDYLVEVRGGELAAGDDAAEARWFAPDELDHLPMTRGLREVVEKARVRLAAAPPVR